MNFHLSFYNYEKIHYLGYNHKCGSTTYYDLIVFKWDRDIIYQMVLFSLTEKNLSNALILVLMLINLTQIQFLDC